MIARSPIGASRESSTHRLWNCPKRLLLVIRLFQNLYSTPIKRRQSCESTRRRYSATGVKGSFVDFS